MTMENFLKDILQEAENIKNLTASCLNKKNISGEEYRQLYTQVSNLLFYALSLSPKDAEIAAMENRITEKLSAVIDTIIERKIGELRKELTGTVHHAEDEKKDSVQKLSEETKNPESRETPQSKEQKKEGKVLSDVIAEKIPASQSVYDLLSRKTAEKEDLAHIPGQKISDLEKAISLNEKFIFIKELFGGNARQYNEAISAINSMKSMEEALSYIQLHYNWWDKEDSTVRAFLELVQRRFL